MTAGRKHFASLVKTKQNPHGVPYPMSPPCSRRTRGKGRRYCRSHRWKRNDYGNQIRKVARFAQYALVPDGWITPAHLGTSAAMSLAKPSDVPPFGWALSVRMALRSSGVASTLLISASGTGDG